MSDIPGFPFGPGPAREVDPAREAARLAEARKGAGAVTVPKADFEALLAVATLYAGLIPDDQLMTLPEKFRLQEVEEILERHGKRY